MFICLGPAHVLKLHHGAPIFFCELESDARVLPIGVRLS